MSNQEIVGALQERLSVMLSGGFCLKLTQFKGPGGRQIKGAEYIHELWIAGSEQDCMPIREVFGGFYHHAERVLYTRKQQTTMLLNNALKGSAMSEEQVAIIGAVLEYWKKGGDKEWMTSIQARLEAFNAGDPEMLRLSETKHPR